jgi:glutaredoxin
MKYLVLLCLALAFSGVHAGDLFRWVDSTGKVHYGDMTPADASQVERKKFPTAAPPSEDISYETRRAQQNFPVTLYVADNCTENCEMARNLLNKRGIPFSEKKLTTKADIDAFKALSGSSSAPTLAVGRHYLSGFQAEQWHGELDVAGYPKTGTPHTPPVLPASAPVAAGQGVADKPDTR